MMTTPEMNTNFDRKNEKARAEEDKDPHSAATNISVNFLILKQKQCLSNKLSKVRWSQRCVVRFTFMVQSIVPKDRKTRCHLRSKQWILTTKIPSFPGSLKNPAIYFAEVSRKKVKKWQCFEYHIWKASVPMLSLLLFDITYDSIYGFVSVSHRVE